MEIESVTQPAIAWAMQMQPVFIKAGGVFNAAFGVFHLAFYRLFNWREDLRTLTFVNRGIVRVLNFCLTVVFMIFAYLSLAHTEELLSTALGFSLTASIALFWLVRTVQQMKVFGLDRRSSLWLFLILVLGTSLYGIPAALTVWSGAVLL